MTHTLTIHSALRLTSLVLGLLYSYYIIYWHEVYVAMSVHTLEEIGLDAFNVIVMKVCLLYTSPSPRDLLKSRMPSSA